MRRDGFLASLNISGVNHRTVMCLQTGHFESEIQEIHQEMVNFHSLAGKFLAKPVGNK